MKKVPRVLFSSKLHNPSFIFIIYSVYNVMFQTKLTNLFSTLCPRRAENYWRTNRYTSYNWRKPAPTLSNHRCSRIRARQLGSMAQRRQWSGIFCPRLSTLETGTVFSTSGPNQFLAWNHKCAAWWRLVFWMSSDAP